MIVLLIISFILEGILSSFNSILFPMLVFSTLPIIYKYKKKSIMYVVLIGIMHGIIFSNLFLIDLISYFICFNIIIMFFRVFKYNYISVILITILNIVLYRIINFILLLLIKVIDFSWFLLLKSIYSSLIINIIFISLVYILFKKLCNKKNISIYN
ncbi:MAG: hypothetical protein NC181_01525 [Clostridium sp.]|nr:hypothetical protein [Clostridium sp.]MCM1444481.1 hypothetical protein [Candidatus Amulumruptor caecigallinarius]